MLSQLTKTIKMALKSTEEERAILRARSAVQRFPVVEWRQRMEDFHKRSITMSRNIAGPNAWRESDCEDQNAFAANNNSDDWSSINPPPSHQDWDAQSTAESRVNTPGSPGQWSQDNLSQADHLMAPPLLANGSRKGSFETDTSNEDYFSHSRAASSANETPQAYEDFLERANRAIAREQKGIPDPFVDATLMPNRPFGAHSRAHSSESIASIVDEKSNSPLNKAIASVNFQSNFPMSSL